MTSTAKLEPNVRPQSPNCLLIAPRVVFWRGITPSWKERACQPDVEHPHIHPAFITEWFRSCLKNETAWLEESHIFCSEQEPFQWHHFSHIISCNNSPNWTNLAHYLAFTDSLRLSGACFPPASSFRRRFQQTVMTNINPDSHQIWWSTSNRGFITVLMVTMTCVDGLLWKCLGNKLAVENNCHYLIMQQTQSSIVIHEDSHFI